MLHCVRLCAPPIKMPTEAESLWSLGTAGGGDGAGITVERSVMVGVCMAGTPSSCFALSALDSFVESVALSPPPIAESVASIEYTMRTEPGVTVTVTMLELMLSSRAMGDAIEAGS